MYRKLFSRRSTQVHVPKERLGKTRILLCMTAMAAVCPLLVAWISSVWWYAGIVSLVFPDQAVIDVGASHGIALINFGLPWPKEAYSDPSMKPFFHEAGLHANFGAAQQFIPMSYPLGPGGFSFVFTDAGYIKCYSLVFPFWAPIALCLLIAGLTSGPLRRKWLVRRRRKRGACPACGYDLRGTPDHCPECGWKVLEREKDCIVVGQINPVGE